MTDAGPWWRFGVPGPPGSELKEPWRDVGAWFGGFAVCGAGDRGSFFIGFPACDIIIWWGSMGDPTEFMGMKGELFPLPGCPMKPGWFGLVGIRWRGCLGMGPLIPWPAGKAFEP